MSDGWQGRELTLCTDGNSFLGLHSDHYCNGKPPEKAVPFSLLRRRLTLIKKIVHFSVSILMLNSERVVMLHLKHKILWSWFLSHHSYSDFIHHVIEIPISYRNFEMQKLLKVSLGFGNHFDEHFRVKLKRAHGKNHYKILCTAE